MLAHVARERCWTGTDGQCMQIAPMKWRSSPWPRNPTKGRRKGVRAHSRAASPRDGCGAKRGSSAGFACKSSVPPWQCAAPDAVRTLLDENQTGMLVVLWLAGILSPLPARASHRLVKQSTLQVHSEASGFKALWYLYEEKSHLDKQRVSITFWSPCCASPYVTMCLTGTSCSCSASLLAVSSHPPCPSLTTLRKQSQVQSSNPSSLFPIAVMQQQNC